MSLATRRKIAYWFFMFMGMAGVFFQMYEFMTDHIQFNFNEMLVTSFFSVFIFRPTVLLDLFEFIKNKIAK
jgi:uncharacterized membrane protein